MPKRHSNHAGSLESLFLRLEELVLANSGEDEFEEVFKLLIAKLWDERSRGGSQFKPCAREAETYRVVTGLLREAEVAWPGILEPQSRPLLTPEHLHVCVEALAKHTISDANFAVIDGFFEFLVAKAAKGAKGQYFTPRYVVEFCVRMVRPRSHETVLDPACGSGGFLIHTWNFVRQENSSWPAAVAQTYGSSKLWGFDIDSRAIRVAKALMILADNTSANIFRANSLLLPSPSGQLPFGDGRQAETILTIEDVCRSRLRHYRGFDVILTNPPFAGEVRERHILDGYPVTRGRARVERDVLFLERCVQLLRPGGRMAIVLPHNKFATNAWGPLREWLLRKVCVLAVVGLGRNTFLPHTHQKASILFARKHPEGYRSQPDERIFMAISERDGKNSKGQLKSRPGRTEDEPLWDCIEHDLGDIVGQFHDFCRAEAMTWGA